MLMRIWMAMLSYSLLHTSCTGSFHKAQKSCCSLGRAFCMSNLESEVRYNVDSKPAPAECWDLASGNDVMSLMELTSDVNYIGQ